MPKDLFRGIVKIKFSGTYVFRNFYVISALDKTVIMSASVLRKAYILSSICCVAFISGLVFGQMPGMISAFQKREDGINFSDNEISLIASTVTMFTIVGFGLVAVVNDKIGRRWSFILFSIMHTFNWIILYFAKNMLMFLTSRILGGTSMGALVLLILAATSEYAAPKTRAFFINLVTMVAPIFGTGIGHFLGMILHWRSVAICGIILSSFGVILPYFWVESPQWLATQGRFEECQHSFRKLNVMNPESEKELRILIKVESNKLDEAIETNSKSTFRRFLLSFRKKYFWELISINMTMNVFYVGTGKLVFTTLATVILEEMTKSPDVMLFTISVDLSMLIGSILSCILIRLISLRNLLFSTGFTATACVFVLSVCLYFKNEIPHSQWLNVFLLAICFVLVHAGPLSLNEVIIGEMYPTDLKLYFIFLTGSLLICMLVASIMLLPHIILLIGYHGYFFMNSLIMSVCLMFLWNKIPETKGKTLQEIEAYFKVKDFDVDKALNDEQIKTLI